MAISKKHEFGSQDVELAGLARSLAHPARIAILRLLAAKNSCICGEIVNELPLSQSTVSQHLRALKDAGLIDGEIEGPKTCYCLNQIGLSKLKKLLPKFLSTIECNDKTRKCC